MPRGEREEERSPDLLPPLGTPNYLIKQGVREGVRQRRKNSYIQGDSSARVIYSVAINLGSSPGLWAATAASYCPSRPGELPVWIAT